MPQAPARIDGSAAAGSRASVVSFLALLLLGGLSAWWYFWARDLHRFTQWLAAYIWLYAGQFAIYAAASLLIWRTGKLREGGAARRWNLILTLLVIAFAAAFRFELVAQRPYLSADVYRYAWDGRVQASGINPYRYAPNAPELEALRDDKIFDQIPRADRDWISPYPPVAQAVFFLAHRAAPSSVIGFKVMMTLFDLVAILALAAALRRAGHDPARVVLFAWHPLLIFESAHSGHVEAVYIALIALAMLAWTYKRTALAGGSIGAAMLVKFYPAVLLPAFLGADANESPKRNAIRRIFSRESALVIAGFALAAVVLWVPYAGAGGRMFAFVTSYVADEGFAGGGSRYFLLELVRVIAPLPAAIFVIAAAAGFAFLVVRVLMSARRTAANVASAGIALIGTYLLLTTPRYAWYYAWLLPLLCFAPRLGWLYLASAAAFLYLVWYTPLVYPNVPLWLGCLVYLPALALLAVERVFTRR
jgi:hypothetical protein